MLTVIRGFGGESPRVSTRLLSPNMATSAINCKLWSGEIRPFYNPKITHLPALEGDLKTVFFYNDTYWLAWNGDVDVVRNPIASDANKRIYYTGDGAPKVTDSTLVAVNGHGNEYPTDSYLLGLPKPTTAITAAATDLGGSGTDRDILYTYTWVTAWGEESAPCYPLSNSVTCKSGEQVNLTTIGAAPTTHPNISKVRIYRAMAGFSTTVWRFLVELNVGTTSYVDTVPDGSLGESLPSLTWLPPPEDLQGLVAHPGGFLVGFRDNEVYCCEPYRPHAWPIGYMYTVPHEIVGLGVVSDTIVCLTREYPYLFSGAHPSTLRRTKFPERQPCVSKRGIVSFEAGVLFPSPDGLYLISDAGSGVLSTKDILTKGDWYKYKPDQIHATVLDQKYFGFYKTGVSDGTAVGKAFVLDLVEPQAKFTELDIYAHGTFIQPDTDVLYMSRNIGGANVIQKWEGEDTRLFFTWKSKTFPMYPQNPAAAQVVFDATQGVTQEMVEDFEAAKAERLAANQDMLDDDLEGGSIGEDEYGVLELAASRLQDIGTIAGDEDSLAFRLYVDGVLKYQTTVASDEPFTLPAGYTGREMQIEVTGNAAVQQIVVASSITEIYASAASSGEG